MKIAIIYRGNIRGFKYDECFKTHEKLYNVLKNNNIDFDTYLCTNNIDGSVNLKNSTSPRVLVLIAFLTNKASRSLLGYTGIDGKNHIYFF